MLDGADETLRTDELLTAVAELARPRPEAGPRSLLVACGPGPAHERFTDSKLAGVVVETFAPLG